VVEAAEQADRFEDGELVGELRILKLDAEPLAELRGARIPAHAQHFDVAGIGGNQPLADFHGGGLAGAVRSEQAEAFAGADFEFQAVDGEHILVSFPQVAHVKGGGRRGGCHLSSIASRGWIVNDHFDARSIA